VKRKTKPNFGALGAYGQRPSSCAGRRGRPAGAVEVNRAKQTQFAPARKGRWGIPDPAKWCDCAKQTQFGIPSREEPCRCDKQSQFARRCCGPLYKQTQFGVPGPEGACRREQTNPIGRSEMRETNPIPRLRPPVAAGGDNIADGAKQTQFAEVHHRGTEIAEAVLDSFRDMPSISFSVASVFPW
jgi:hypothetical protein